MTAALVVLLSLNLAVMLYLVVYSHRQSNRASVRIDVSTQAIEDSTKAIYDNIADRQVADDAERQRDS